MKKTLVSILIGLFMVGVSGQAWAGKVVAADLECTNPAGCVQTDEISDGAVTEPKLATDAVTNTKIADGAITEGKVSNGSITNAKIADNAITDLKISGTIAASKLEKPANVVVVAKSGGDFTSIQAAIDSINPTAENPYLIKVMPGVYVENIVIINKDYIHLQGAGKDVTIVQSTSTSNDVIYMRGGDNSTISDFTIKGGNAGIRTAGGRRTPTISNNSIINNNYGIHNLDTSPFIVENIISGNGMWGIWNDSSYGPESVGAPTIERNKITGNGYGIRVSYITTIKENTIQGNSADGISAYGGGEYYFLHYPVIISNIITTNGGNGIYLSGRTAIISDNIISSNAGTGVKLQDVITSTISGNTIQNNGVFGVQVTDTSGYMQPQKIHNNEIVNNGGIDYQDIYIGVFAESNSSISFNIYDDITGGTANYTYNVKSDGTPAPIP